MSTTVMDRTQGIGGSDIHHLFNLEPYGCRRALWYEKRGVKPDYPFLGNYHTLRGQEMEDLIAQKYQAVTGRKVRRKKTIIRHPKYPFLIGHIDREIVGTRTPGVLEIKCPSEWKFKKIKRDGADEGNVLQLQHYLLVSVRVWGSLALFSPELWELLYFDNEKDEELQREIEKAACDFWENFVLGSKEPARLNPYDKRCQSCQWRTTCQGEALKERVKDNTEIEKDLSLASLIQEYQEALSVYQEAEEYLNELKDRIRQALGDRQVVETEGARIYYRVVEQRRWDTRRLAKEHPELKEQYQTVTVSRPLKIYLI